MSKLEYYKHFKIRPLLRGWHKIIDQRYKDQILSYCPNCDKIQGLVSVGFMNHVYWNKLIEYQRCEYCLLKLPVKNQKIMKILGLNKRAKPKGQETLMYVMQQNHRSD